MDGYYCSRLFRTQEVGKGVSDCAIWANDAIRKIHLESHGSFALMALVSLRKSRHSHGLYRRIAHVPMGPGYPLKDGYLISQICTDSLLKTSYPSPGRRVDPCPHAKLTDPNFNRQGLVTHQVPTAESKAYAPGETLLPPSILFPGGIWPGPNACQLPHKPMQPALHCQLRLQLARPLLQFHHALLEPCHAILHVFYLAL